MHDPMTVAFEIKYPWRDTSHGTTRLFPKGYRHSFITVWHVDPETDGTDDSCGYSRPRLSKEQKRRVESIAGDEAREPWYLSFRGKQIESPTEAETLLRQAILLIGRVFSRAHLSEPPIEPPTYQEASEWAADLLCSPIDNLRSSLSFRPGYHSNSEEDRESDRKYSAERLFYCVAGYILTRRRPWYRHPRFHVWHWKLQIHPLEQFKRWAFSRCADCGGRFRWGQSGWTNTWEPDGPRWFKSERDFHHDSCSGKTVQPVENTIRSQT